MSRACCTTWDANEVIAETPLMRAVLDGYPVTPGHALVYPRRHVDRFADLRDEEVLDLHRLVRLVLFNVDADAHTIGVNDGELAGRTVPHLHVHVIPRRAGDVPDPRGGVRRLLVDPGEDPYLNGGGHFERLLEASSLGTSEAVSDETVQQIRARARRS